VRAGSSLERLKVVDGTLHQLCLQVGHVLDKDIMSRLKGRGPKLTIGIHYSKWCRFWPKISHTKNKLAQGTETVLLPIHAERLTYHHS
jgi:hypothetical protein